MNFFQRLQKRLQARRRNRQFDLFREWYQLHEQAKNWTGQQCPACSSPVIQPDAAFCFCCGLSLTTAQPQQQDTDPLLAFSARARARARLTNTDTLHVPIPPKELTR